MKVNVVINVSIVAVAVGLMAYGMHADAKSASIGNRIEATDVALKEESVALRVGETKHLTAKVLPSNATDKFIAWYSDAPEVVTVSEDGVVKAVAPGKAIITTVAGGEADMCTVTVAE